MARASTIAAFALALWAAAAPGEAAAQSDGRLRCSGNHLISYGVVAGVVGLATLTQRRGETRRRVGLVAGAVGASLLAGGLTLRLAETGDSLSPIDEWHRDRCRARWAGFGGLVFGAAALFTLGSADGLFETLARMLLALPFFVVAVGLVVFAVAQRVSIGGPPDTGAAPSPLAFRF